MIRELTEDWKQCLLAFYQEKLLQKEYKKKNLSGIDMKDLEILCILNQIELRDKIIFSQSKAVSREKRDSLRKKTLDYIESNRNLIRNKSEILDNLYQNDKKFDYYRLKNMSKGNKFSNSFPNQPMLLKEKKRSVSYHMVKNFTERKEAKNPVYSKFMLPKIEIEKKTKSTSLHSLKENLNKNKYLDSKISRFFQNSKAKQREKLQSLMNEKNYLKYKFGI